MKMMRGGGGGGGGGGSKTGLIKGGQASFQLD